MSAPLRRSATAAQGPSGFITYQGFPKEKCFVLCAFMSVKCTPQVKSSAWVPVGLIKTLRGSKKVMMDGPSLVMASCFVGAIRCPTVPIRNKIPCHTLSLCHSIYLHPLTCHLPNPLSRPEPFSKVYQFHLPARPAWIQMVLAPLAKLQ